MMRTTIVGVDCAVDDAKVGLSIAIAENDRCITRLARACSSERGVADQVAEWLASADRALIAFDAPLGWPRPMGETLAAHRAGEPLVVAAHSLFRRETDRFVRFWLEKQSLDVGADRIARTAHSALNLLADLRRRTGLPIPLAWSPSFSDRITAIEVYPAATLVAHGIPATGYKKPGQLAERSAILGSMERIVQLPEDRAEMERSADALDAAICVLAGFDFLQGRAFAPENLALANHEGWIWVRPRSQMQVSHVLNLLQSDGWYCVKSPSGLRQFKHPTKPGRVTVSGKPSDEMPPGTLNSVLKQAGLKGLSR